MPLPSLVPLVKAIRRHASPRSHLPDHRPDLITEIMPSATQDCLIRLLEIKEDYRQGTADYLHEIVIPSELFRDDSDLWGSQELIQMCHELIQPL